MSKEETTKKNKSGKSSNKELKQQNSVEKEVKKTNTTKKTSNNSKKKTDVKGKTTKSATGKKPDTKKTSVRKDADKKVDSKKEAVNTESKKVDAKKDNKKKTIEKARRDLHFQKNEDADEFTKLAKIVLIVTAIIIVFYFMTVFITRKANAIKTVRNLTTNEKAEIQYDSLIIGSMLKIDGTYYVLIEADEDNNHTEYETLLQTIAANDDAPKIYTANLTDSFNKKYLAEESNYDSDLSKFKVKGTTLVKVSDHKIDDTYDNYDSILEQLEKLK